MDIPSHATDLMMALGPQTESIDWIGFDHEQGVWSVGFDDQSSVLVEWFGEQVCFMLHALLGKPPSNSRVEAYQAVLAYNTMWRDNGGARIGMVDSEGELALMVEVPAASLTPEQLQQIVLGVKSQAAGWRLCLANPCGPGDADRGAPPSLSHRV